MVREIDWDDEPMGVLRVWALVDDVESATEPEVGCELLYPSGRPSA
ncbi:MAG: hypothetical protein WD404_07010 [Solirubrobacterales bacterium]